MVHSLYNYGEVKANHAPKQSLNEALDSILKANGGECYTEIEKFLLPPGQTGSKYFDQAYAVSTILVFDKKLSSEIAVIRQETPAVNERVIWDVLQKVLRKGGFKLRHGRIAGLLTQQQREAETEVEPDVDSSGQPDID